MVSEIVNGECDAVVDMTIIGLRPINKGQVDKYQSISHRQLDWIGLSSVLRLRQHSIGYMGDNFYRHRQLPI